MTTLQAHLKAVERVLSPGDLAKVIGTTPETVSRLRGGRRPRRANEVAVPRLRSVMQQDEAQSGPMALWGRRLMGEALSQAWKGKDQQRERQDQGGTAHTMLR